MKKGFFFFNYEAFRLAHEQVVSTTTLLPAAQGGAFTFTDATGATRNINVLNGTGFTSPLLASQGGVLGVDPVIQARLLAQLPSAGNGLTTGTNYLQTLSFNRGDLRNAGHIRPVSITTSTTATT